MKKLTTVLAVIGAVCAIVAVIHAVNWSNTQNNKMLHNIRQEQMFVANKVGPRR